MRGNLKKQLNILVSGTPVGYRVAKREIEKIFHAKRNLFHKNADVIFEYLEKFEEVKNVKNQEAFISGISLFFLALADEHFEKLSDFILKVIQNPDGHVREMARKTSDWLTVSLSERMEPFTFPKRKLNQKELNDQKKARSEFKRYLTKIEALLEKYSYLDTENVEYIDQMKPSILKSLMFLWNRETDLLRHAVDSRSEIIRKREEIEKELTHVIKKSGKDIAFWQIKNSIWEEQEHKDYGNLIGEFDNANSLEELNKIVQLLSDAWNYFPHKSLRGKCPVEIRLESLN